MTEGGHGLPPGNVVTTSDWQPVYGALIMIMLVFFVMLLSQTRFGEGNLRTLQKAALGKQGKKAPPAVADSHDPVGALRHALSNVGLDHDVEIVKDGRRLRLTIRGSAFHEPGGVILLPKAESILREALRHAGRHGSLAEITVGADCRGASDGSLTTDWELAVLRAANLQRCLVQDRGFPAERLKTVARGAACPPRGDGRGGETGNVTIIIDS
ncbi:MAG: hypothetical protein QM278_10500 [Pseudomonadota bacterium]|nr:hypothetical protein [Pseudomonadota bacterium]